MPQNYICKGCNYIYKTDWYVPPNPKAKFVPTAGIHDIYKHFDGKCPKCGKQIERNISSRNFTRKGIVI
ncbi:MAG: hypothetical protein JSV20_01905 [Candidatus Bathyarchaeota archaeon]|nr:MAG: hypothetical protein JSV20_01905 [Candidatus Bathyarchaeota archaeon]